MLRRTFMTMPIGLALVPKRLFAGLADLVQLTPEILEQIGDEMLPATNKYKPAEHYDRLLVSVNTLGVHTVGELRKIVTDQLEKVLEVDRGIGGGGSNPEIPPHIYRRRKQDNVFFLHMGLIRQCIYRVVHRMEIEEAMEIHAEIHQRHTF